MFSRFSDFYPVCPSVAEYVVGSPTVSSAVIHTDSGKDFVIKAEQNSDENIYVGKMLLNGKELDKTFIDHFDIKAGRACFQNAVRSRKCRVYRR